MTTIEPLTVDSQELSEAEVLSVDEAVIILEEHVAGLARLEEEYATGVEGATAQGGVTLAELETELSRLEVSTQLQIEADSAEAARAILVG